MASHDVIFHSVPFVSLSQECREHPPGRRIFSWRTTNRPSSGECPWTRTGSRTSGRSSPRWRSRARARRRRRADYCWPLVGLVPSRPLPVLCCRTYQIPTNFRLEGGGGGRKGGRMSFLAFFSSQGLYSPRMMLGVC